MLFLVYLALNTQLSFLHDYQSLGQNRAYLEQFQYQGKKGAYASCRRLSTGNPVDYSVTIDRRQSLLCCNLQQWPRWNFSLHYYNLIKHTGKYQKILFKEASSEAVLQSWLCCLPQLNTWQPSILNAIPFAVLPTALQFHQLLPINF